MKKLKTMAIWALALAGFFAAPVNASAQNELTVEVTVVDEIGPVAGASAFVAGTTLGDVTDEKGVVTLSGVPSDATLVVSFIGYATQNIKVEGRTKIKVTMSVDAELLEETVVVGYGVQKKESLTSAISQITAEDIENTKQIDVITSLQGKIPGLLINQNNSRPGDFNSTISLRGYGTPMIVIDGIVRSGGMTHRNGWMGASAQSDMSALQELDPNDIESISVLKDASAAIYGLGAANGVILVTTKKGKVQKPQVSFSANFNSQSPTVVRDRVPWAEFLRWDTAMRNVSRMAPRYSEDIIEIYEKGGDADHIYYDWYENLTKKATFTQNYNASMRGGTEQVQYYFGLGYADDDTMFKTDSFNYNRYNLTGNVTAKLTNDLEVRFQTQLRITNTKQPGSYNDLSNLPYYLYNTDPTTKPWVASGSGHFSVAPENKNGAAILDPNVQLATRRMTTFNNTLDLTYNAPFLKGLRFQASGAYDYSFTQSNTLIRQWEEYDYWTDTFVAIGCGNGSFGDGFKKTDQYTESWMYNTRLYGRLQANYNKRVGKHDIQAMVAAETTISGRSNIRGYREYGASPEESFFTHDTLDQGYQASQTNSGSRSSSATAGYLSRVNYNYDGKYFAEVMARYDGTYVYAPGKRWGLFPSYSLGWRISEEPWFKQNLPAINNLKLRWSDGFTGSVQGSAYAYLLGYNKSGSYSFSEGSGVSGYNSNSVAQTVLSWADVRMMDAGLDWELWRGKFGGSFDWFTRITSGIAATRTVTLPDFYGASLPSENLNKNQNMGLELMVYHRDKIGEFNYRIQGTATFTRSRTLYVEADKSAKYTSSYNYWTSHSTGRWDGTIGSKTATIYNTLGQFHNLYETADADIMYNTSKGNADLTPGQYIIEDRNGNGYLDGADVYYKYSTGSRPLQFGLQASGSWRKFDFSLVFSGSAFNWKGRGMTSYAGTGYFYYMPTEFRDSYHVKNWYDDPWDPKTEWVEGYYPALQGVQQVGNGGLGTFGGYNLSYNFFNAAFLRLKTIDVGYTVDPAFLKKIGIKGCRFNFNGTNLYTFCNKHLKYLDPESVDNEGGAGVLPPNKAFSFGFRLNF